MHRHSLIRARPGWVDHRSSTTDPSTTGLPAVPRPPRQRGKPYLRTVPAPPSRSPGQVVPARISGHPGSCPPDQV